MGRNKVVIGPSPYVKTVQEKKFERISRVQKKVKSR